ncbi:sulfurtransferase [Mycolicibacterium acapulense]|uniref:Sulfurtransferase n=2 Tax=Mycobacterium lehmannii TaxID=2048550 RepID=A0A101A9M9_9MYCO|nr:sulfurtransferase [Mycolicibacterium acapulense]KUI06212.1 sulfurtransferase [Mycolicibacterium acapulense]KUI13346.1 sulfurtransferase [Mycolicibacterium acapulense]KUI18812.1 sulfurtransferase [Mycobacterium lehmannii]
MIVRWGPQLLTAVWTAAGVMAVSACVSVDGPPAITSPYEPANVARILGPGEFAAAIDEPDRLTLNVHVPFEGDIPGTDMSIPFDQIAAQANRLPADRDTALAVYCRSGPMSTVAAEALSDLGYTDVVELRGGMRAWQAEGRQIIGI